ncbi:MAG TPA: hypothetical protein VKD69_01585 [Vicinamibacterales bacterium]|nr:hypothetical protein [Vicinamibacterales bacterium]
MVDMSDERFLEEQLKRIIEMTEQITRLQASAAGTSVAYQSERIAGTRDPLHPIRGTFSSAERPQPDRADEHEGRHHRRTARQRRK